MPPRPPGGSPLPSLPQDDSAAATRVSELENQRDVYRHVHDWPAGVSTSSWLPEADDYSRSYVAKSIPTYTRIAANYVEVAHRLGTERPHGDLLGRVAKSATAETALFKSLIFSAAQSPKEKLGSVHPSSWHDYKKIFGTFPVPDVVAKVDDLSTLGDAVAWQRVAGCNPTVLAQVTRLPDHFPVTDDVFRSAMGAADSLAAAIAERRLYLADYAALDGVTCGVTSGVQKYLAAPLALYAVPRSGGRLKAVCVQCGQDPSVYPIVTAATPWLWRMANQAVQTADANHHEGSAHLGRTHMVMEAVTLAMKRQLSTRHPLHVLLAPHTETTLAINASAKTSLIAPGGVVDSTFALKIRAFGDFVRASVGSFRIDQASPRQDLAARGLLDANALPVHPYREDAIPVWDAIADFVGAYVRLYYRSSADVVADTELRALVDDLSAQDGGRLVGVTAPQDVPALATLITTFVFLASAQHSAVNFPQYPYMGYVPNMGGALYTPPPTRATPDSEAAYTAMLAPTAVALDSVTMVYLLSEIRDSALGAYDPGTFTDPRVAPILAGFQQALARLDADIAARDAKRWLPYPFLRPSQILQSISI